METDVEAMQVAGVIQGISVVCRNIAMAGVTDAVCCFDIALQGMPRCSVPNARVRGEDTIDWIGRTDTGPVMSLELAIFDGECR